MPGMNVLKGLWDYSKGSMGLIVNDLKYHPKGVWTFSESFRRPLRCVCFFCYGGDKIINVG